MDLVTYLRLLRKWFWLVCLGAFLAGGVAFLRVNQQPDLYRSSATIQVGTATVEANPNYTGMMTAESLAKNYVVLARSYDIVEAAVEAGSFPISVDGLRNSLSASVIPDTSLIVLTVTYTDPVLASDMANEIARQLIALSPSNLTTEQEEQIALQKAEIARLEQELAQARVTLSNLDSQIAGATDSAEIQRLKDQRIFLVDQINQASGNIATFSSNIASLQQRTNALTVIEQARVSGSISSNVFTQVMFGAFVGAALAIGLVLLIEHLDDTLRSPSEATQLLGVPTLAAITRFGKPRDSYVQRLITYRDPGSPISEEYRTLRTNLLFSSNGGSGKNVYVLTSAGPSEGKTVTSSNLAVTMAMAGWRVLLVDADLRRPRIHDIFNLDNHVGLSTLLSANPVDISPLADDRPHPPLSSLDECIQNTEIPGLRVITSGHIPLNPTEVLGSAAMQRWYQEFRARDDIDIVLFDTPPALVVADSAVLASAIEAPVVLVLEAKGTRRGAATTMKEQFDQLNVRIAGLVLNAVDPRDRSEYGYGYGYYYYYSSDTHAKPGASG